MHFEECDADDIGVEKIVIFDFDGVLCQHTMDPKSFDAARDILEHLHTNGCRIMIASFNEDAYSILESWGWSYMIHDARCGGVSKPNHILSLLSSPKSGWCQEKTRVFFFDDDPTNIAAMSSLDLIVTSIKIDPDIGIGWKDVAQI